MQILNSENPINWKWGPNLGLVSRWYAMPQPHGRCGWGSGMLFDLAGRNHGTLTNGPTWSGASPPGGLGSLSFDGTNDYVNTSTSTLNPGAGNCTISGWFKGDNTNHFSFMAGVRTAGGGSAGNVWGITHGNFISGASDKTISLGIYQSSGGIYRSLNTNSAIDDGKWHHIVGIVDSVNGLSIRIDGATPATTLSSNGAWPNVSTTVPFTLGAGQNAELPFVGNLTNWSYHNRALSASEIAAIYQDGLNGNIRMLNWINTKLWFGVNAVLTGSEFIGVGNRWIGF